MSSKESFINLFTQAKKYLEQDLILFPKMRKWYPDSLLSPVISLGMPKDGEEIDVLTVCLSPSLNEYPNLLSERQDIEEQNIVSLF